MKNKKKIVIPVLAVLVIICVVGVAYLVKKYMPSRKEMALDDYFGAQKGELQIILQDRIYENRGLYTDDVAYVDYSLVHDYLNPRFYWDAKENLLLYTTPTAVISASTGSQDYYTNKSKSSKEYTIVRVEDGIVYVALDYIQEHTALNYVKYDAPDRVVITYRVGEEMDYAKAKSKAVIRYEPNIKSDILVKLKEGAQVCVLEKGDTATSEADESAAQFDMVMSEDGIIGYIRKKDIGEIYQSAYTSDFKEEEYSHILKDGKVCLAWHQVTTAAANDGLLNLLNGKKGVNVVSPTWFSVSGNKGEVTSLASDLYVSRARSMGVEVWGLCDDFSGDSKIGTVLSQTSVRQKLEKNLIAEAIKYSLDGLNIDFEHVKKDNADDFIQFIRELGIMCRNNGIILSIDNYPPASYSEYYNRTEQAAVADYVITMAYDEYYAGSEEAGPVSSLGYVQDSTVNTIKEVPAEQTIIALPFYSRLWKETTKDGKVSLTSEAYGMSSAKSTMTGAGAEFQWNDETGMNYAEYTKDGTVYKMWLEDEASLEEKMKAATEQKVGGLAFWKLGLEDAAIWDKVIKYTN